MSRKDPKQLSRDIVAYLAQQMPGEANPIQEARGGLLAIALEHIEKTRTAAATVKRSGIVRANPAHQALLSMMTQARGLLRDHEAELSVFRAGAHPPSPTESPEAVAIRQRQEVFDKYQKLAGAGENSDA